MGEEKGGEKSPQLAMFAVWQEMMSRPRIAASQSPLSGDEREEAREFCSLRERINASRAGRR